MWYIVIKIFVKLEWFKVKDYNKNLRVSKIWGVLSKFYYLIFIIFLEV